MKHGRRRGGDMWVWMCCIKLGVAGLTYFIAKCGRLRCVGLDIVEGVVKTVDVFDKSILGVQGGVDTLKCALQRTHEEILCIPGRNIPFQACSFKTEFIIKISVSNL
jgi:hypothetical protein